eukprot:3474629-Rhodomonas_salina.1
MALATPMMRITAPHDHAIARTARPWCSRLPLRLEPDHAADRRVPGLAIRIPSLARHAAELPRHPLLDRGKVRKRDGHADLDGVARTHARLRELHPEHAHAVDLVREHRDPACLAPQVQAPLVRHLQRHQRHLPVPTRRQRRAHAERCLLVVDARAPPALSAVNRLLRRSPAPSDLERGPVGGQGGALQAHPEVARRGAGLQGSLAEHHRARHGLADHRDRLQRAPRDQRHVLGRLEALRGPQQPVRQLQRVQQPAPAQLLDVGLVRAEPQQLHAGLGAVRLRLLGIAVELLARRQNRPRRQLRRRPLHAAARHLAQ